MAENPILEDMGSGSLNSSGWELDKLGTQKISVSDQTDSLQVTNFKSDSFIVDTEALSQLTDKDITASSRITRTLSRKLPQQKSSEKKFNSSIGNEKDNSGVAKLFPRGALAGPSTPEKPMVVTLGTKDQPTIPHFHHQITIMTSNIGATAAAGEVRCGGKRLSFRRSSPSWAIDPRRILLFFATLSSMGTILLIYFTLSMSKLGGEESALN
ncbi:E3 ubiquitin-protein like [Actinidia chinensis var. chinensis]|uniref:E3 ubiquitin-protein like n=1 Tax=Actinidia chinensis var. chinensis TaxID=1590841 RepID=A0A2R6Q9Z1_ACTCC|nr:E3 ubiquitin-protein like [Actinidia chinensis var. chinensis]